MSVAVAEVIQVAMYRDGGSLGAEFRSPDGVIWELRFPICLRTVEQTAGGTVRENCGHGQPLIARRVEFGSVAEGHFGYRLEDERMLSWEEARQLLAQIRALAAKLGKFELEDLGLMEAVAARDGARAPDQPQFSTWRRPGHVSRP